MSINTLSGQPRQGYGDPRERAKNFVEIGGDSGSPKCIYEYSNRQFISLLDKLPPIFKTRFYELGLGSYAEDSPTSMINTRYIEYYLMISAYVLNLSGGGGTFSDNLPIIEIEGKFYISYDHISEVNGYYKLASLFVVTHLKGEYKVIDGSIYLTQKGLLTISNLNMKPITSVNPGDSVRSPHSKYKTYLIHSGGDLYKIGRSAEPHKRLEQLSIGNPRLLLFMYADVDIERILHDMYEESCIGGEWFKLSDEQLFKIYQEFGTCEVWKCERATSIINKFLK